MLKHWQLTQNSSTAGKAIGVVFLPLCLWTKLANGYHANSYHMHFWCRPNIASNVFSMP